MNVTVVPRTIGVPWNALTPTASATPASSHRLTWPPRTIRKNPAEPNPANLGEPNLGEPNLEEPGELNQEN
jgi:hypothetical protein